MPFPFRADFPTVLPSTIGPIKGVEDPYNYFNILHVEDAITYIYLDADRGHMAQKITSEEVAKACVDDFMSSMVYADTEIFPGLFWLPGEYSKAQVEKDFAEKLKQARLTQDKWFTRLVETADDEWARAKHHRSIAPVQRLAAQCLGLEREWIVQSKPASTVTFAKCPACMSMIDSEAIVCMNCRCVVKPAEYSKLQFANPVNLQAKTA